MKNFSKVLHHSVLQSGRITFLSTEPRHKVFSTIPIAQHQLYVTHSEPRFWRALLALPPGDIPMDNKHMSHFSLSLCLLCTS